MSSKKLALAVTMVLAFSVLVCPCAFAEETESVTVDPLSEQVLVFNLDEGVKFSGSLAISGGNNDIDFWVTNPEGQTILDLGRVSDGKSFNFTADKSGAFSFHFNNDFSVLSSKVVTLSYNIDLLSAVTSLPDFWLILIGALIIIVIAAVAFALRKR
ncbi:MAG: emp24/gp25L/p24 family protein [Candidatus Bathyarchaeota archaeon]|nr:emp24/gp25L/p24 family protein [Candidatus Bathyarchaeota archaeon]